MEFPPQLQTTQARPKGPSLWLILSTLLISFLLLSCAGEDEEGDGLLRSGYLGGAGEVVLVVDKAKWNAEVGDAIREVMNRTQEALPQSEPIFDLLVYDKSGFSDLMRRHRNIVIIDIEDNARNLKTRTEIKENKWAKGQVVFSFHALNDEEFINEFKDKGPAVAKDILVRDRNRMMDYQRGIRDAGVTKDLTEDMGIDLTLPRDYRRIKKGKHFSSFLKEQVRYLSGTGHDVIQGVLVYEHPYYGEHMFTPEYQAALRDSLLEDKVQSALDSPMIVERLIPPVGNEMSHLNNFAYEVRGLWKFDSPIMGGPFISLSMVDQDKGRVITVDGYVFAPKFDKREFIREMEAIVYSLKF